jgi:hypothetical protein
MVVLRVQSASTTSYVNIGLQAGSINQDSLGVAIGKQAGYSNQGANAIAIGAYAGVSNQAANSIVINASGNGVNVATHGLFIKPVREAVSTSTPLVTYNSSTCELSTGSTDITVPGNIVASYVLGNIDASNITSGILSVSRGGTGVSSSTGTGSVVLNTAPTLNGDVNIGGNVNIGQGTYKYISINGGNSNGYFYSSFPRFGDCVHIGHNYYATTGGADVIPNASGGTSRITLGYGEIGLYVGAGNTVPTTVGMFINPSGRIGIATSSPKYALDIGGFSASTNTLRIATASTGNSEIKLMEQYDADTYGFTLRNVATDRFAIVRHNGDATGVEALQINRSTGALTIASDTWHKSSDGKERVYYSSNSTTYYRTGANYHWHDSTNTTRLTLNLDNGATGTSGFYMSSYDGQGYLEVVVHDTSTHPGTFFNAGRIAGGYVFRHAGNDAMFLTRSTTMIGFEGLTLVAGNAQKPGGGSWASYSDRRLKTNIAAANVDICYDIVKSLPLQRFDFVPEYVANTSVHDTKVVGWIADEVEVVFPKAVTTTKAFGQDDIKTLDVDQLYKTMWGAMSKIIAELESVKIRVDALENP